MNSLDKIWDKVLSETYEEVKNEMDKENYQSFFLSTKLISLHNNIATVIVPFKFNIVVLENYVSLLQKYLHETTESQYEIELITQEEYDNKENIKAEEEKFVLIEDNLLSNYTFDRFVVGESNRVAYAAAQSVCIDPGNRNRNPLFISGNSGLGKTHLLHAIGNKLKETRKNYQIYYTSVNKYMKDYVDSLSRGQTSEFENKYYSLDVLLLDDIQFLEGKEKTAEVFFHLFNHMVENKKQIVITSDRLPQELVKLEKRLISRFSSGLSVGIDTPEFETSLAILKKKIQLQSYLSPDLIDEEVLNYMASHYGKDIRELEGKLTRILFDAVTFKVSYIDLDFVLKNSFKDDIKVKHSSEQITPNLIIRTVAKYYNLQSQQLIQKGRTANVTLARHIAMYLIRQDLNMSYVAIGKLFGNRDHATVMKACDKVEKNIAKNPNYKIAIDEIRESLK